VAVDDGLWEKCTKWYTVAIRENDIKNGKKKIVEDEQKTRLRSERYFVRTKTAHARCVHNVIYYLINYNIIL